MASEEKRKMVNTVHVRMHTLHVHIDLLVPVLLLEKEAVQI